MLTSRERVIKAFNFEPTDRVPRDLWQLYGILMLRKEEHDRMRERFDFDVCYCAFSPGSNMKQKGKYCEVGQWTDAWGCTYTVGERGYCGEVKDPPIDDWSKLKSFRPPYEIIDGADWDEANRFCGNTDKFVLAGGGGNPFERLQYLRGTENVYLDLAYGTKEVFDLLEMIHDYNCRNLRYLAKTDVDGVQYMDDWGSQNSLLIAPKMWREIFKPLYKDYVDILHEGGKRILMHSDGFIEPIIPDLIDLKIDAVNAQLFCMDMEMIAREYGGKIVFYGEIDRQNLLPFATTEEVRAGVRRVNDLFKPAENGGIVAECCWGIKDPYENVEAVFDEWEKCYG
jgi:uroporphyrinogen decarboxylase